MGNLVYQDKRTKIYQADALKFLKEIPDETFDVIATDPPYFISDGGITCKNGKMVSVDKGEWDKEKTYTMEEFYNIFLSEAKRILKPNGTIWVFGMMKNIYTLGYLMQKKGFKILNNITWQKTNPAPNLSCRMFTHSTENIIWAKRDENSKHYFDYDLMREMNGGRQMKDVWSSSTTNQKEKQFGYHLTQKPLEIMNKIILASTREDDLVLDCFMGSGTTLVACSSLNRNSVGIELNSEYIDIAISRLEKIKNDNKQISFRNIMEEDNSYEQDNFL